MKRVLISVYDKTGVEKIAKSFSDNDYEIISTGGTAKYLKEKGFKVIDISEITHFKEMLDGRVKTLHPKIHGGLLAIRENPEHMKTLEEEKIGTVDAVVVNLYPFFDNVHKDIDFDEKIEFIDIGGPTMLRSAAKNFKDVLVICDPNDYDDVIEQMKIGEVSFELKKRLAGKVFNLTSAYDAAISNFLLDEEYPEYLTLPLRKKESLRYGENPHQTAALYENLSEKGLMNHFEQIQGKKLSYNNINDLDVAFKSVHEFEEPSCVGLKHKCPCGIAIGSDTTEAYKKTYASDPVSIFGGIVAFNRKVTGETAAELVKIFLEVIVAPAYEEEALKIFKKKKNLRILKSLIKPANNHAINSVDGGMLIQSTDKGAVEEFKMVTKSQPTNEQIEDMHFGIKAIKNCTSNAILIVKGQKTLGICGGQVNRIWAAQQALERANMDDKSSQGAVLVSDAFFPFSDVVQEAAKYGISAIVQPGGSIKDKDSIEEAEKNNMPMIFTGIRHFKH
ncbi:MAG: bifunctional phosphoribosylaminoimidazolecarboxamide formyltransferase/IMP cyclohydrolase [Thermotogota bacterium]